MNHYHLKFWQFNSTLELTSLCLYPTWPYRTTVHVLPSTPPPPLLPPLTCPNLYPTVPSFLKTFNIVIRRPTFVFFVIFLLDIFDIAKVCFEYIMHDSSSCFGYSTGHVLILRSFSSLRSFDQAPKSQTATFYSDYHGAAAFVCVTSFVTLWSEFWSLMRDKFLIIDDLPH